MDGGGVVVPFGRRWSRPKVLNVSERIQTLAWAAAARSHGVRDVHIHEPEPGDDPVVGGFLLIYRQAELWAAWGVAMGAGGFEVWRPGCGTTVGWHGTLREALHTILAVA